MSQALAKSDQDQLMEQVITCRQSGQTHRRAEDDVLRQNLPEHGPQPTVQAV